MPRQIKFRDIPLNKFAYTMVEAQTALGVGRNKFYDLIRAGEITPFPFCGRPHLHRDDLEACVTRAFVSTHRRPPGAAPVAVGQVQPPSARRRRSTPA